MDKDDINFLKLMVSVLSIGMIFACLAVFLAKLSITLADYLASMIL